MEYVRFKIKNLEFVELALHPKARFNQVQKELDLLGVEWTFTHKQEAQKQDD